MKALDTILFIRSLEQLDGETVTSSERADATARFKLDEIASLQKTLGDREAEVEVSRHHYHSLFIPVKW